MKIQRLIPVLFLAGFCAVSAQTNDNPIDALLSTNRLVRFDAAVRLDTQRKQLVQKLIVILDGTNSIPVKLDAVIVMSEYRAPEAVPVLVSHLEWDEDAPQGGMISGMMTAEKWAEYAPVRTALTKIGVAAIPALLDKISETDDTNITAECVTICHDIEGTDVTEFCLRGLLEKESDQKRKERVQAALESLKRIWQKK